MLDLDNFKYISPDKGLGYKHILKLLISMVLVGNLSWNFQYSTQSNHIWLRFHTLWVSIDNKRGITVAEMKDFACFEDHWN